VQVTAARTFLQQNLSCKLIQKNAIFALVWLQLKKLKAYRKNEKGSITKNTQIYFENLEHNF
jgi:hypothetical protein